MIFLRLLEKMATENWFKLNSNFLKQTGGSAIGDPLYVTLSDILMVKMENNIVIPHKPIFYKRYVDDIMNRRKKHEEDLLFKKLINYHLEIKLTIEINRPKFLDTDILVFTHILPWTKDHISLNFFKKIIFCPNIWDLALVSLNWGEQQEGKFFFFFFFFF